MKCSLEISMYPLSENYEEIVLGFLDKLEERKLDYRVSGISTQVFGEMDVVWNKVGEAIQESYAEFPKASFIIKMLSGEHKDLIRGY